MIDMQVLTLTVLGYFEHLPEWEGGLGGPPLHLDLGHRTSHEHNNLLVYIDIHVRNKMV